jgi:flagellar hook-associated protein 3 FlgL
MHINRNMRSLDRIIRSIETGRRIQRPSDDPIIASRALMFRTNVHENEQFQSNVEQGIAWMNVTEATFNNINNEILLELRNLAVTGANGPNNLEPMQAIIRQMQFYV